MRIALIADRDLSALKQGSRWCVIQVTIEIDQCLDCGQLRLRWLHTREPEGPEPSPAPVRLGVYQDSLTRASQFCRLALGALRKRARQLFMLWSSIPLNPEPFGRKVNQVETPGESVTLRVRQLGADVHQLVGEHVPQRTAIEFLRKLSWPCERPQGAAVLANNERRGALYDVVQQAHDSTPTALLSAWCVCALWFRGEGARRRKPIARRRVRRSYVTNEHGAVMKSGEILVRFSILIALAGPAVTLVGRESRRAASSRPTLRGPVARCESCRHPCSGMRVWEPDGSVRPSNSANDMPRLTPQGFRPEFRSAQSDT